MAEGPSQSLDEREAELFAVVAQLMKAARLRAGLSVAELADRIGVKKPYVFELERGLGNPTLRTLNKVAVALGADPSEFFPHSTHPLLEELHAKSLLAACDSVAAILASCHTYEEDARHREAGALEALRQSLRQLVPLELEDKPSTERGKPSRRGDRHEADKTVEVGKR